MSVTIRQIAERAGVSRGTVDRVLNGRPGVKPDIRNRIMRIAEELNYVPNVAAKALAYNKKPVLFGIVMPPEEMVFFDEIRNGIRTAAEELKDLGIRIEYHYVNNKDPEEGAAAIRKLVAAGAAGILFSVMDDDLNGETIDRAVEQGVPVVTFNSDVENSKRLCFVGQDLRKSGKIAAGLMNRVLDTHRKVLIIVGSMGYQAHRSRANGFKDWIAENNANVEVVQTIEGYHLFEDTYQPVMQAIQANPDIGGIYMAAGNIEAVVDIVSNFSGGHRIHMVCNDVLPVIEQGLRDGVIDFTISQNPYQQGYRSLRILYEYIFAGKSPESEYFFTETDIKIWESL